METCFSSCVVGVVLSLLLWAKCSWCSPCSLPLARAHQHRHVPMMCIGTPSAVISLSFWYFKFAVTSSHWFHCTKQYICDYPQPWIQKPFVLWSWRTVHSVLGAERTVWISRLEQEVLSKAHCDSRRVSLSSQPSWLPFIFRQREWLHSVL